MVRRVLMIAFHFPPMRGSSGAQRTLNFCRNLPRHGWEPRVLTVNAAAHPEVSDDQLSAIPDDVVVRRAPALDAARHAAIAGRYPRWLADPDRWATWWLTAVPAALREIRRWRPDVIWSTFPIATAHRIAATLELLGGRPWVADFRDSMTEEEFPADPRTRAAFRRIEQRTVDRATRVVFTTPGTLEMYAKRYPRIARERWACIANGYSEEDFNAAAALPAAARKRTGQLVLLHSGLLYPIERNPAAFLGALAQLQRSGRVAAAQVKVVLRATGHDQVLTELIRAAGVEELVELKPPIPYREALAEMMSADGLLIFQAANCNHQIPAKLYEYLRAGRPILALTDAAGDTARTLRTAGIGTIAPLDQADAIRETFEQFLVTLRAGRAPRPNTSVVASYSRAAQSAELSALLDQAADTHPR